MLPIDLVKSGKAHNNSFEKTEVSMGGFLELLAGGYPTWSLHPWSEGLHKPSGIKTFEIQYGDIYLNDELISKQNGLPASVFVEINWDDSIYPVDGGTIRTFFATQPTIGDETLKRLKIWRTPFYTFPKSVDYGHNGIEHYDYPALYGSEPVEVYIIHNKTRSYTHEPRHDKQGAFAQWLLNTVHEKTYLEFKVFHIDIKPRGSHILNWKQGIEWMESSGKLLPAFQEVVNDGS